MHTQYNELASTEWPGTGEWLDLSRSLSVFAELYGPFKPSDYKDQCTEDGKVDPTNPVEVASAGEGICMQYPTCSNKYCLGQQSASPSASALAARSNLPAYVLEAKAEEDIVKGMQFANKYKIQVTVKSSGHSLMGASTAKDSLLIWLAKYPVDNTIQTMYQDSCKDPDEGPDVIIHDAVIGVAAGQNFKSIAEAVGDAYHFVSASEWTVSASGGFFQGGGLSYTSRKYGLGVDNVVDLRVVLPSGSVVIADRCTNKDLFWALRGGGGGTFGVVTHMNYKLHKATPIVRFQFNLGSYSNNTTVVSSFLKYWAEVGPTLDARWGGRFSWFGLDLFFAGYQVGANSFVNDFLDWVEETVDLPAVVNANTTKLYTSWSKVLPDLEETAGNSYVADTSFSRLVPYKFATDNVLQSYQLMESLALSRTMGYSNFLLGEAINEVSDEDTSVNPAMRESAFLLTANKIGYEKMLEVLPNNMTGSSKNHVGSLEPEWRASIWGDHYDRLLNVKKLVDPLNILNCYQSVGFVGDEADIYNVNSLPGQPTNTPKGPLTLQDSSGAPVVSVGVTLATFLAVVTTYALAIC